MRDQVCVAAIGRVNQKLYILTDLSSIIPRQTVPKLGSAVVLHRRDGRRPISLLS
jgi:hypothetical protein